MLSGLSSIETLSLSSAGPNTVTLGTNLIDVNVAGSSASDTVTLALATQYASLGEGNDTLVLTAATMPAISSYGGGGQDTIRIEGGGIATLGAGVRDFEAVVLAKPTVLFACGYLDAVAITGSLGADQVLAGTGQVSIDGNDGNDFLVAGLAAAATVLGGAGDDTVVGSSGADTLDGGAGTDTLRLLLAGTVDLAAGTAFANAAPQITDTLAGFETVVGSLADDSLFGDANPNRLEGGQGNDLLEGRAGADTLDGGAGNDTILYTDSTHGSDTVQGFTAGGTQDALMFFTPAFLLHDAANWGDAVLALDDGASALPADTVVLAVVGTALDGAAAVDAYLAARLPVAGGLLVLAQAGPGQAVTLWYDACADVVGGGGTPLLLASFNGVAGPGSFTSDDFLGVA
jgi:Ca2+-binding RTX toxin-like protein